MSSFTKKWNTTAYSENFRCGKLLISSLLLTLLMLASGRSYAISGTLTVCAGSTTSLSDGSPGGVWSSSNVLVATVIGSSGVVTGVAAGTATISYTIAGVPTTTDVTVNPVPSSIGGAESVCNGSSITLSDFTPGGTWSSSGGVSLTAGTTTTVTGTSAGATVITYSLATGCYKTYPITVLALPAAIMGNLGVCTGGVSFLSDPTGSGTWAINPVGTATISPSGRVYGVSAGTAIVTFTGSNTCAVNATVTVNTMPVAITGNAAVCPTASITLSNATGGGTWLSSNPAVATVGSTDGLLTGVSGGNANIYYATGAGCGVMVVATVNAAPNAGSLSGSGTVCTGATTSFSDAISGGVWSSTSMAVGTVNTSGVVKGISVGTTTISYTVTNVCGSAAATAVVTVSLSPSAGTILGAGTLCAGSSISLSDAVTGGSWLSSTPAVGTVDATFGYVTGISAGTTMIYYTVTNGCGSASATKVITVNAFTAGTIGGPSSVTAGLSITLTDAVMGGVWWADNSNATVSAGMVTGVTAGTVTISYTITNGCGTIAATKVVTVTPSGISPITGTLTVCAGMTTALTDATAGGTWTTGNNLVATVGTSGVVTGVAAGTATIYYTVGGIPVVVVVTVNPVPSGIGGPTAVCNGSTITLNDFTTGGTWTSTAGVSVTTGGTATTVTGLTNGANTVTYSLATGCYKTYDVMVNALPTAILGTLGVCTTGISFLSDATTGGAWTISPVGVATISPSGRVYGVSAGTAVVSYTGPNTCVITATVTVTASPGAIMGNAAVCPTASLTLTDATGGGTWLSSNPSVATVGSGDGLLTGVSAGTANIYYSTGAGCSVMTIATVNASPNAGTLSGSGTVCTGATTSFSDAVSGGAWSSTTMAVGTVNTSGVVRGLTVGTTTISYTVTNVCGSAAATAVVTVGLAASAGTITGNAPVCAGSTLSLTDATSGGSWLSSTPTVGSIDASTGVVAGLTAGTTMIYYTVTNSCGSASTFAVVTVNAFTAGTVNGTATVVAGLTTMLTDLTMGGVWSAENANATVSGTGLVTGVTAGTVTISYTVTNGCGVIAATKVVTVTASSVSPITGTMSVCVGMTTALTDATPAGVWMSGNTGIATVGTSGVVTGVAAGTATIYYTVAGVPVVTVVTVNPNPSPIGGPGSVCNGSSITLNDFTAGGTWTSTAGVSVTTGTTSTTVTGLTNGANTVTYSLATGCYKTYPVMVNPLPTSILGTLGVCTTGISYLSDATTGGAWTISPVGVATISPSGRVYGVSAGTAVVSYTGPNTCITTATVTVTASPGAIMGNAAICPTTSVTLTNATGGGSWLSSNGAVATVGSGDGLLTGVGAGTANIYYFSSAGCLVMTIATVNASPNAGTLSGSGTVCTGATTSFSDAVSGGAWSSTTMAVGTVNTSGVVRGLTVGTTTISYTVTNVCGSAAATAVVTVGLAASAGTITGNAPVCAGSTLSLTDATSGGSWLSSTPTVGSVDASTGVVAGLTAGTTMIYYTVTNSCGSASTSAVVTVNAFTAGTVNGTATVVEGLTTMLTDLTMGGVWSAENANATVSGTGLVTGVTAGTVTISYTVTNGCGVIAATKVVTVTASSVSPITGTMSVCVGMTTALTDATPGGTWLSLNTGVATVGTSGVVTGIGAGVATIRYTVAGVPVVAIVTVNANPSGIGGPTSVCNGSTITLNDFTSGGTWTSTSGVSVTTGGTSSTVTGLTNGVSTVTYSLASGCYKTYAVTVKAPPTSILGTMGVCTTGVSFLSDATTPGAWTISPVGVATISASGRVYGVSAGTAVVTYTGPNTCITTATVTVTASPGAIMGNAAICPTASVTLTNATGGGAWLSSNGAVATVGSGDGLLTGVGAGTANIYYTTGAGCSVMTIATVNANPNAGTLSGTGTVCTGATTSFSDGVMGGIWSSTTMAVGTVNTSGVVRGLTVGTTTISYTVTNACGSAAATAVVTVGLAASAGTITGNAPVCAGSTLSLTDATAGGSWLSSTPTVGSVDAVTGVVTGISGGSTNIYYTVTNSCGSASTAVVVTVNAFTAGTINGVATVTEGLTTLLTDATMGGVWSSANANATVSGIGLVTGVTAGTATISYTVTNICGIIAATKVVTVNASSVAPITGVMSACVGMTTALTDITPAGTWASLNTGVATVGTSGVVTGVGAGTATIRYTVAGVPVVAIVTINANPSSIGGPTAVCNGSSITLNNYTAGGTWTSTGGLSVTTGTTSSAVTGLTDGLNTVTYSLGSGCYKTYNVTVKPVPSAILGNCMVCGLGSVTFLSDATSGISWAISPVGVATISPTGRVYGVSAGTATVTYTATNSCIITAVVTVAVTPVVAPILGATNVSSGASITLSDATPLGIWSSSNPALGSVDPVTGVVTGVGVSGVVIITYTIIYPAAGCAATATKPITVHTPAPHSHGGSVGGMLDLITGSAVSLDEDNVNGTWISSNSDVATVQDGLVIAVAPGTATITHVGTNASGAVSSTQIKVVVSVMPMNVNIVPNPNNGTFTLSGTTGTTGDEAVTLEVTNVLGQTIYTNKVTATGGKLNETITLTGALANGMYMLNVHTANGKKAFHFVMEQ